MKRRSSNIAAAPAGLPQRGESAGPGLKPETIGLSGAIMQNVANIAPAISAFFFTQTLVGSAGAQAPLAYVFGLAIVLALGTCLAQLARRFPSAGGYFTYVNQTLGPRMGLLTGWMFVLYSPVCTGPSLAFLGQILEVELAGNYGWHWFHWWMIVGAGIPLVAYTGYAGVSFSIRSIVLVGTAEVLIVAALGISGLLNPGPGGFSFQPFTPGFNPGHIASFSGFVLAVVLTVQGLTGWEGAVPLAEETINPRRNVPRSIMASIVITGMMLVIANWGQVVGWGTDNIGTMASSAELPALVLAHRVWGRLWWIALLAIITSSFGVSFACQNVATRMWFAMGRAGVLPRAFARVHPVRRTPTLAVTAQAVLSILVGLVLPWLMGPKEFFIFLVGFVLVLAVIFIYVVANIGIMRYWWTTARAEFSWLLHFLFPAGTSLVLIYSLYVSFLPSPAGLNGWAFWVFATWLVLGIAILWWMKLAGKEVWLSRAAEIITDHEKATVETPRLGTPL
jgi:amino acid transporter